MPDPLQTVNADLNKAVVWYKSHLLWAGAILGLVIGLVIDHFLKL